MRVSFVLSALLAAETAVASSWFTKAAYNKFHETELERWLSDHDVPYPTPADRKDLENLVKSNWQAAIESPYVNWDTNRLQKQLEAQGVEVKKSAAKNKNALAAEVKKNWADTVDSANGAYGDVKTWIFDSWTDSQLKAFCDAHGIPVPQPRTRDVLLKNAREGYQTAATKAKETVQYPGDWLWAQWSDSDLKSWLDSRGIPAPQGGQRDRMVATVRRNSRIAAVNAEAQAKAAASSASASAQDAAETISDTVLDAWSDSQIKEWADKNGVKVPQGSNRNELLAIVRKYRAKLTGDNVSDQAAAAASSASKSASKSGESAYGAATSSAGNEYNRLQGEAKAFGDQIYSSVMHYVDEAQIALGLKTNYASSASRSVASASKSASSAYAKASKSAKAEL